MKFVVTFFYGIVVGLTLALFLFMSKVGSDTRKQKNCLWPMENGSFTAEPFTKTCFMSNDGSQKVDCTTLMRMAEFNHMKHCFQ